MLRITKGSQQSCGCCSTQKTWSMKHGQRPGRATAYSEASGPAQLNLSA